MDKNGLKRKDTTKGPPLRILSLDGGGVRGYSMLIILQELMHRTYVEIEGKAPKRGQIPKPCDHFDLIVGTGTGGLIAIMLGRLRLDLETCKEVYVRMTRKVFETDKTIAGIPYRSTLYKASKLEEAIKECVREHTVYETEGNDGDEPGGLMSPISPLTISSPRSSIPQRHASNASTVSFSARGFDPYTSRPVLAARWGNPNAKLYDEREKRTKTAVTAIYKGTPKNGAPAILRSYDSRKEAAPEFDCTIWEAGRATSATGLAFKPIQIGQSVFIDEGAGKYNPAPYALDEAVINEWPGRDVGVFVSVGTGKRPHGTDQAQHLWYEGFMGEFAEARRRLIAKIEGCEVTHQFMVKEYLAKRGVNIENYYRLNVEIGVGEFGMNEWSRLADISTGTRRYLSKSEVHQMNQSAAAKLAKIHRANLRYFGGEGLKNANLPDIPEPYANAVEMPAEVPEALLHHNTPPPRSSYESGKHDMLEIPRQKHSPSPRSSVENHAHPLSSSVSSLAPAVQSPKSSNASIPQPNPDKLVVTSPTPAEYKTANGDDKIAIINPDEFPTQNAPSPYPAPLHVSGMVVPPPLPPKTPIPDFDGRAPNVPARTRPPAPYPLDDGPPPVANMARKPKGY
ncbi:acyl transferase/acyl hydrolase/lysophospholipase [Xylogone sp. PMI_703]|nr:acyl transferase/acyl hydrolase/lysophospholipase [Xylogone sp. PMI_703]